MSEKRGGKERVRERVRGARERERQLEGEVRAGGDADIVEYFFQYIVKLQQQKLNSTPENNLPIERTRRISNKMNEMTNENQ